MARHSVRLSAIGTVVVLAFSGVAAGSVALTTKSALPKHTGLDVKVLVAREQAMIRQLTAFQRLGAHAQTGAWATRFKTLEAGQASALAALNRDIDASTGTPTPQRSGPHVIFSTSGSGVGSTRPFTIPASDRAWQINWSYNCSAFGSSGNFDYDVNQGTQTDFNDLGPNQLGPGGHGVEHYYDHGTFNLQVDSECSWTVQVVA